ncbi:hypothetical protein [Campylobacter curvus]|nr:hypothetical protein [Campylobacter curvus]UEB50499.1 hypothetical protein LK426_03340 [Campylobacter curvus]
MGGVKFALPTNLHLQILSRPAPMSRDILWSRVANFSFNDARELVRA